MKAPRKTKPWQTPAGWLLGVFACFAVAAALGWGAEAALLPQSDRISLPPGTGGMLGTDPLGRDLAARLMHGSAIAFLVGSVAAAIAVSLGTLGGIFAGLNRNAWDTALSWMAGSIAAVPTILLILLFGAALGPGLGTTCLAIGFASWVGTFRLVRAETQRLRATPWIAAAQAAGAGKTFLAMRHLIPNLAPLWRVQFGLHFVAAVQAEAIISFLGLGPIEAPSWGRILAQAPSDLSAGVWWPLLFATLALAGLSWSVQSLCDGAISQKSAKTNP